MRLKFLLSVSKRKDRNACVIIKQIQHTSIETVPKMSYFIICCTKTIAIIVQPEKIFNLQTKHLAEQKPKKLWKIVTSCPG